MMRFLTTCLLLTMVLPAFTQRGDAQGQLTMLGGFYAVQTNQCIRASHGRIDVLFNAAYDSTASHRVTQYACSTNGGFTWDSFNGLRVPERTSGHPTLDAGKGTMGDAAVIVDHSSIASAVQSTGFVDSPGGGGAFAELSPPPAFGSDEPVDPFVAVAADGSIIMFATRTSTNTCHLTRTGDYIAWSPWMQFPGGTIALGLMADTVGHVSALARGADGGILLLESSDCGVTWSLAPQEIVPPVVVAGTDSFATGSDCDLVFSGTHVFVAFSLLQYLHGTPSQRGAIGFWSEAAGVRVVERHSHIYGIADSLVRYDGINYSLGQPAIGVLRSFTYIVFFVAMQAEIPGHETLGVLYYAGSGDGGNTWWGSFAATCSSSDDQTYPGTSKTSNTYRIPLAWQTRADTRYSTRAFQMYSEVGPIEEVGNKEQAGPKEYALSQNYPNPFNPVTTIFYSLPFQSSNIAKGRVGVGSYVTLKAYDLLGREVAILVNEMKQPGTYTVPFDASGLASGVYFYRLQAGSFVQTKKLIVSK